MSMVILHLHRCLWLSCIYTDVYGYPAFTRMSMVILHLHRCLWLSCIYTDVYGYPAFTQMSMDILHHPFRACTEKIVSYFQRKMGTSFSGRVARLLLLKTSRQIVVIFYGEKLINV
jgi:hypothetical protein